MIEWAEVDLTTHASSDEKETGVWICVVDPGHFGTKSLRGSVNGPNNAGLWTYRIQVNNLSAGTFQEAVDPGAGTLRLEFDDSTGDVVLSLSGVTKLTVNTGVVTVDHDDWVGFDLNELPIFEFRSDIDSGFYAFTDTFDRPDASELGPNWAQTLGDIPINSNKAGLDWPSAAGRAFHKRNPYKVVDTSPLDNSTILAVAVRCQLNWPETTDFEWGGVFKSTDGGATYSQVVADTRQLNTSNPIQGGEFTNTYINVIGPDPTNAQEVWVVMAQPWVYHSSDAGDTWVVETVDMSIFPAGDDTPVAWSGVSVTAAVKAARLPFVTLVGAT